MFVSIASSSFHSNELFRWWGCWYGSRFDWINSGDRDSQDNIKKRRNFELKNGFV